MGEFSDALGTAVLGYERQYFADKRAENKRENLNDQRLDYLDESRNNQYNFNRAKSQAAEERAREWALEDGKIPIDSQPNKYGDRHVLYGSQADKAEMEQKKEDSRVQREKAAVELEKSQFKLDELIKDSGKVAYKKINSVVDGAMKDGTHGHDLLDLFTSEFGKGSQEYFAAKSVWDAKMRGKEAKESHALDLYQKRIDLRNSNKLKNPNRGNSSDDFLKRLEEQSL